MTKTIRFKSTPEHFRKEYLGLKLNTVRKSDSDLRFNVLDEFIANKLDLLIIEIENTETGEFFFRKVTNVTKFSTTNFEDYYIISWGYV